MANIIQQNQNQFAPTAMLGQASLIPDNRKISVQIDPSSTATYIQNGSPVKLVTGASSMITVDVTTGPTDGPVYGVILFNPQVNKHSPGDVVEIVLTGAVLYLESGAAVTRGALVSSTAASSTSDPLVSPDSTTGDYITGMALDEATAAGQLIRVEVAPSQV